MHRAFSGCIGTAAMVAAMATAGAAMASAQEATTTFQVPAVGLTSLPIGFLTLEASAGPQPGTTHIRTLSQCSVINPPVCQPFVQGVHVHWLNVNTGASGSAAIPSGNWAATDIPPPATDVATGPGRVIATVTVDNGGVTPGFGTFEVG
ncbi:MAG: hypothetical protein GX610_23465 [Rhodococcus sp.]|nr:hypothetical protein [Rhodococcus sp. (in: high G+C Gram-positive bacteria)]